LTVGAGGGGAATGGAASQRSSNRTLLGSLIETVRTDAVKGGGGSIAPGGGALFPVWREIIAAIIPAHVRAQETAASLIGNTGCIDAA
jgi:hypothetical protein